MKNLNLKKELQSLSAEQLSLVSGGDREPMSEEQQLAYENQQWIRNVLASSSKPKHFKIRVFYMNL